MNLSETLRPKTLTDVIGQERAIAEIRRLIERNGAAGQCLWLAGESGTGKTSIAGVLAAEWGDEYAPPIEYVGRAFCVADAEKIRDEAGTRRFGGGVRVWIVNEAQDLSRDTIKILLDAVERVGASKYDAIIFTSMIDLAEFCGQSVHHQALFDRFLCPTMARTADKEYREAVETYISSVVVACSRHCPNVQDHCKRAGWRIRAALNALDLLPDAGSETEAAKPTTVFCRHAETGHIAEVVGNRVFYREINVFAPLTSRWIRL